MTETQPAMTRFHGTAIAFGDEAVLIRGIPGSGKSSLALRLIDAQGFGTGDSILRARLVADDQVEISRTADALIVSPPLNLAGLLEIRGLGIVAISHQPSARLVLVVDLVDGMTIDRLPPKTFETVSIAGFDVPGIKLGITDPVAAAKLRSALCLVRKNRAISG